MVNQATMVLVRLFIVFLLSLNLVLAEQAAVQDYKDSAFNIGQSFLARYGETCLVFMPSHVALEAASKPALLKAGAKPVLGLSQDLVDLGDDASMGVVQGELSDNCGQSMSSLSRAVDAHVQKTGLAALRWVNPDGSQGNIAVSVVDHGDPVLLRIQPANNIQQIRKGMSGSVLWANGHPVGVLLSVNAARGRATVFRMDTLLQRAERQLRGRRKQAAAPKAGGETTSNNLNFLDAGHGASVIAWSALAVAADRQASNLIDPEATKSWQVEVKSWPLSVELNLVGEKQILGRIQLSGVTVDDPSNLPGRVAVFLNIGSERKSWRSLLSTELSFGDSNLLEIRFQKTWARNIRFEFYGKQDQKFVEVSGVKAFEK